MMRSTRQIRTIATSSLLVAVVASGCSSASSSGDSSSVEIGSTKEEFVTALQDIDPIELRVQVLSTSKSAHGQAMKAYGDEVEDWSGGKITFDLHYSGAIASTDVESALADGLIDLAPIYPSFQADKFPVSAFASHYTFLGDPTPVVGTLEGVATWLDAGFDEGIITEFEDNGLHAVLPMYVPGRSTLICNEGPVASLKQASGASIRNPSPTAKDEIEAIGGSPTSLPPLEVFEGLQRGTVDCAVTGLASASIYQLADVSSDWAVDPEVQFAGSPETLAYGQDKWEAMPLAARQLLWDKSSVFLEKNIEGNALDSIRDSLSQAEKQDVNLYTLDDDLKKKLNEHHQGLLDDAGENSPEGYDGAAFAKRAQEANDRWTGKVEELGYTDDPSWPEAAQWLDKNDVDLGPLVEEIDSEIMSTHRPE